MQLITCPNCSHQFEPTDAIRSGMEKELRSKMIEWKNQKDEEYKGKEQAFQNQLDQKEKEAQKQFELKEKEVKQLFETEKQKLAIELQIQMRKEIGGDFENQLKISKQTAADTEEKLQAARQKELESLQEIQELKTRDADRELISQKKILEERQKITDEVAQREKQKAEGRETEWMMKNKELEKKYQDTMHMLEEAKRKSEQGSMQLQGEVQELALEELLKNTFPFDIISEVGKGVRGADCIQSVRNNFGQDCGKIIYESKRTKNFDRNWIDKLKADMRSSSAEVAVIVTNVLPTDLTKFGIMEGVWICTFSEVAALASVLRDGIMKVFNATKNQENKGDKAIMMYNYFTSNEFGEQWNAMREGFSALRKLIHDERNAMEKIWKNREKQLEKIMLNSAHIKGSVEGISGQDSIDFGLLENGEE